MTQIILVRHASVASAGVSIAGRLPGTQLDDTGRAQARALVERLSDTRIDAIYSSPLERCLETANPIASARDLAVTQLEGLNEIDFGEWTGMTFDALAPLPEWQRFNSWRSLTRIPGGESMADAQARGVHAIEMVRRQHPEGRVVVLSHGDLIRCLLVYYLGMPIDHLHRLDVAPASLTVLELWDRWVVLRALNVLGPLALD